MAPALLGAEARSAASAASEKHLAGAVFRIVGFEKPPPLFADIDIQEPGDGAVTRRHPVTRAIHARPDGIIPGERWLLTRIHHRPSLAIEFLDPGLFGIRLSQQEFPGLAVQHVVKAVPIGMQQ
jgi:hypothetical protein